MSINRRDFLKKSTLGVIAAGVGSKLPAGTGKEKKTEIVYRTLGRTGLKVPLISFGVMNTDKPQMLHKALEMGVLHYDTAHVYLNGNSERVIGKVMKETGKRKDVYIATKMRFARDRKAGVFTAKSDGRAMGATVENLKKQLDISLGRLQTDYIDILYIHSCYTPAMATNEELMKGMEQLKKSGKVRFIGVSTHRDVAGVTRAAVDAGIYDVVQVAYNYLQKDASEIKKALAYAKSKGVGIIGMKTFGGGRMQSDSSLKINNSAALKFVLNDESVSTVIPGMTTFEQMAMNFSVMGGLALTPAEMRDLTVTAMLPRLMYCQNCRECIASCPAKVEIPNLMRAYMYDEGYGNLSQAQMTVAELPEAEGLGRCAACPGCRARCSHGLDIRNRVAALIEKGYSPIA